MWTLDGRLGRRATLVEISEALLLLLDSRRGGGTQYVLEGAPPGSVFGHEPRLFILQEGCQGLSEGGGPGGEEEKEKEGG